MLSRIYVRHFWRALSFWAKNSINLSFPEMIALTIINKFCFHQPKINYFIIIVVNLWKIFHANCTFMMWKSNSCNVSLSIIPNNKDTRSININLQDETKLAVNGQLIFRYRIFTTSDAVKMSDWSLEILISVTEEVWPLKTSNSSVVRKLYR